jgi:hypothetical protein
MKNIENMQNGYQYQKDIKPNQVLSSGGIRPVSNNKIKSFSSKQSVNHSPTHSLFNSHNNVGSPLGGS